MQIVIYRSFFGLKYKRMHIVIHSLKNIYVLIEEAVKRANEVYSTVQAG